MEHVAPFILPTKLAPPAPRSGRVERARLTERLSECFEQPGGVALVCAPAGWGKSTLISQWLNETAARIAWVQIDPADNDEARLCAHLAAATAAVVDKASGDELRSAETMSVLTDSLVALLSSESDVVLILDDYHSVSNPDIHAGIDRLLQWLPAGAHLIIASRVEPPLAGLSRLRVDGRLVEVRAHDLAFTDAEADLLLADAISLPVEADVAAGINHRAEGWGAGLYLAALSIGRAGDAEHYLSRFAGDTRLVADYLRAELIDGQTAEIRELLLSISVLDEFSGPLCDAVMGTTGSARQLRALERSNLLLVPLDERSEWYRFHHLLLEWLRDELAVSDADTVELHRRAAVWLHANNLPEAAFNHAHAASDIDLGAAIVVDHWGEAVAAGRWTLLRTWFDRLGDAVVEARPRLCIARARFGLNTGESPDAVSFWTETALAQINTDDPELLGEAHRNLGIHLRMQGDMDGASHHCVAALDLLSDAHKVIEAKSLLAAVLYYQGNHDEAGRLLDSVVASATPEHDHLTMLFGLSIQAAVLYERGLHSQARASANAALASAKDTVLSDSPVLVWAHLTLGHVRLDEGDVDRAAASIEPMIELAPRMNARGVLVLTLVAAARLEAARRHRLQAEKLIAQAEEEVVAMPSPGRLANLVSVARAQTMRGERRPDPALGEPSMVEDLTERELAVLRMLPSELTAREISNELYVSHNTTKGHLKAIYRKLGVSSRDDCVARARTLGLL